MSYKNFDNLGDEPLHTYVSVLAKYGYEIADSLPDNERYGIGSTARQHSFRLTDDVSMAIGSTDPRDRVMYYQYVVRDLFGLKNALVMAEKLCDIKVDAAQLVEIERLIERAGQLRGSSVHSISDYLKIFSPDKKEA